ncbi:MAG: hypothetical protein Fur0046_04740 [Cyanobacteria bacterium J069]|nr:MAG: hypothetical protein D6742_16410 [Cyanobacteria bacterium J069]
MEYEDSVRQSVGQQTSVKSVMDLYQWWLNWGDYDGTGAAILERLGEIGKGNPEAIALLQRAASGNIAKTKYAARQALNTLAAENDTLAQSALDAIQTEP